MKWMLEKLKEIPQFILMQTGAHISFVIVAAGAIVVVTAYALVLPAISMEKYYCGYEKHLHGAECYIDGEIACGQVEHVHTDACRKVVTDNSGIVDQPAAGGLESDVAGTSEKTALAGNGHNYSVTLTCGTDVVFPAGAELEASEVRVGSSVYGKSFEEYVADTENALNMEEGSADYIRLFDIRVMDKDNPEGQYQPAEDVTVDVRIELADSNSESLNVVHFADGAEEGEIVESVTENIDGRSVVGFQADSFNLYSIAETP